MVRLRRLRGASVLQVVGLVAATVGLLVLFGAGVTLVVAGVAAVILGALLEAHRSDDL